MQNAQIREALKKNGLCQWQLAKILGINESVLSRRLREELPEEEKQQILETIEKGGNAHSE